MSRNVGSGRQDEGGAQGNCAHATLTIWVGVGRSRDVLYNNVRAKLRTMPHIGKQTNQKAHLNTVFLQGMMPRVRIALGYCSKMGVKTEGNKGNIDVDVWEFLHFTSLHLTRKSKSLEDWAQIRDSQRLENDVRIECFRYEKGVFGENSSDIVEKSA